MIEATSSAGMFVGAGGISHAVEVGETLRSNYLIVSAIMGAVTGLYAAFAILLALMLSSLVLSAVTKTLSQNFPHLGFGKFLFMG